MRITAGLTSIREVATLFNPTRITYKLNKDTFLSNNVLLIKKTIQNLTYINIK